MNIADALPIFQLFAKHDIEDMLYWCCQDDDVSFYINTNDHFWLGTADAEIVILESLSLLAECIEKCLAIDPVCGAIHGCYLYAGRVRKLRPQGAAYPEERDLWPLFDACGPEREINDANPCRPGEYKRHKESV